jgi:putative transposase
MPNHTHLIAVPPAEDCLGKAIGEAHRRYSRHINFRHGWRGHLWQCRFASYPMDERYALAAARYIELNPVRAKLCRAPGDYPWSSAQAHFKGMDDRLVKVKPLLERMEDWPKFLREKLEVEDIKTLRQHERTGRPLETTAFISELERKTNRVLQPQPRGPKPGRR